MKRSDLPELHYITPIANLPSIRERGILSRRLADELGSGVSIADPEVLKIRKFKHVPGDRCIYDCANLYMNARNVMMYVRQSEYLGICVLRVSTDILDMPGVVIADMNAASDYTAFFGNTDGLAHIDKDTLYAERWNLHETLAERLRHRAVMCAEVLVPERVDSAFINGAYVACDEAATAVCTAWSRLPVTLKPYLFFHGPRA
jgi:hypothetical protein